MEEYQKIKRYRTDRNGNHALISQWVSASTVYFDNDLDLQSVIGDADISYISNGTLSGAISYLNNILK